MAFYVIFQDPGFFCLGLLLGDSSIHLAMEKRDYKEGHDFLISAQK